MNRLLLPLSGTSVDGSMSWKITAPAANVRYGVSRAFHGIVRSAPRTDRAPRLAPRSTSWAPAMANNSISPSRRTL